MDAVKHLLFGHQDGESANSKWTGEKMVADLNACRVIKLLFIIKDQ